MTIHTLIAASDFADDEITLSGYDSRHAEVIALLQELTERLNGIINYPSKRIASLAERAKWDRVRALARGALPRIRRIADDFSDEADVRLLDVVEFIRADDFRKP